MKILPSYHNEFSKYIKIEGAILESVFDYLFDVRAEKLLSKKGKRHLHDVFEKWDI